MIFSVANGGGLLAHDHVLVALNLIAHARQSKKALCVVICRILYASGEVEDLDMEEIVRDQHMALL